MNNDEKQYMSARNNIDSIITKTIEFLPVFLEMKLKIWVKYMKNNLSKIKNDLENSSSDQLIFFDSFAKLKKLSPESYRHNIEIANCYNNIRILMDVYPEDLENIIRTILPGDSYHNGIDYNSDKNYNNVEEISNKWGSEFKFGNRPTKIFNIENNKYGISINPKIDSFFPYSIKESKIELGNSKYIAYPEYFSILGDNLNIYMNIDFDILKFFVSSLMMNQTTIIENLSNFEKNSTIDEKIKNFNNLLNVFENFDFESEKVKLNINSYTKSMTILLFNSITKMDNFTVNIVKEIFKDFSNSYGSNTSTPRIRLLRNMFSITFDSILNSLNFKGYHNTRFYYEKGESYPFIMRKLLLLFLQFKYISDEYELDYENKNMKRLLSFKNQNFLSESRYIPPDSANSIKTDEELFIINRSDIYEQIVLSMKNFIVLFSQMRSILIAANQNKKNGFNSKTIMPNIDKLNISIGGILFNIKKEMNILTENLKKSLYKIINSRNYYNTNYDLGDISYFFHRIRNNDKYHNDNYKYNYLRNKYEEVDFVLEDSFYFSNLSWFLKLKKNHLFRFDNGLMDADTNDELGNVGGNLNFKLFDKIKMIEDRDRLDKFDSSTQIFNKNDIEEVKRLGIEFAREDYDVLDLLSFSRHISDIDKECADEMSSISKEDYNEIIDIYNNVFK